MAFVDIADDAARALIDAIEAAGHPAPFYQHCDLTDIAALQATIAEVARRLGPITVLVNNAANDQRHKFEDVTVEYWDERMATNLRHQFFAIQAVAPMMRAAGGGSIINFGSMSWHALQGGMPAYTTAKAGGGGADARHGARSRAGQHPGEHGDPRLDHDRAADHAVADAGGRGEPDAGAVPEAEAGAGGCDADGAVAGLRRQPDVHRAAVGGGCGEDVTRLIDNIVWNATYMQPWVALSGNFTPLLSPNSGASPRH